jgi:transposase-like protein
MPTATLRFELRAIIRQAVRVKIRDGKVANAIESVNASIRRAVRSRGHFPNEATALKCVYLAVMSLFAGDARPKNCVHVRHHEQPFGIARRRRGTR